MFLLMKRNTIAAGKSLRNLRELSGASLEQVASEAAVSSSYLSNVEQGKRQASPEWIATVSAAISRHIITASEERSEVA